MRTIFIIRGQAINKTNLATTQGINKIQTIFALEIIRLLNKFIVKENHYQNQRNKSSSQLLTIIFITNINFKITTRR